MTTSVKKMMKYAIAITLTIGLSMVLLFAQSGVFAAANDDASDRYASEKHFFETYSINPEASIGARGINGTWASCETVEGNTYQEQLNNKLAYIEQVYQEQKEAFIIEDGISLDEATNMSGIQYMFDKSSIYRDLVCVGDTLHVRSECSFSRVANVGQSPLYDRYAFYLDRPATMKLSASYTLQEGKMALWVVSPDGKVIFQNEAGDSFDQIIDLSLGKGLHSLIVAYEMDNGHVNGDQFIQGSFISS